MLVDADGTRLDFGPLGGAPSPKPGIFSTLAASGQGYILANAGPPEHLAEFGNFTYFFDGKKLVQIVDPAGNAQALFYDGAGHLNQVLDLNTGKRFTSSGPRRCPRSSHGSFKTAASSTPTSHTPTRPSHRS